MVNTRDYVRADGAWASGGETRGTLTRPTGTFGYQSLIRTGNTVTATFELASNLGSVNTWSVVANIPVGFRPVYDFKLPVAGDSSYHMMRFAPTGAISLRPLSATPIVQVSASWEAAP